MDVVVILEFKFPKMVLQFCKNWWIAFRSTSYRCIEKIFTLQIQLVDFTLKHNSI